MKRTLSQLMMNVVSLIFVALFLLQCPIAGGYDWLNIINRAGKVIHLIETSHWFRAVSNIDLTAGGIQLSTPPLTSDSKSDLLNREGLATRYNLLKVAGPYDEASSMSLASLQAELNKFENVTTTNIGLLRVHRLGATALKKVPDSFLIGIISLIAAELLQREILRQSLSFPPLVQAIANKTAVELDIKLQLLSALQWNVGPFLEYELDNLQTQPIELLDKYVIGEIVQRIDKDLAPFLSKMIRDPVVVKKIVTQVKAIVEILAIAIARNNVNGSNIATSGKAVGGGASIIENFEWMIEGALQEWNKLIDDLGKVMKSESFFQYLTYYQRQSNSAITTSIATSLNNAMNWEEERFDDDDKEEEVRDDAASRLRLDRKPKLKQKSSLSLSLSSLSSLWSWFGEKPTKKRENTPSQR